MLGAWRARRSASAALCERLLAGGVEAPFLVCGVNVVEDEPALVALAHAVREAAEDAGVGASRCVFKASWDKANRTSPGAFRGPGLRKGLRALARVREETGLAVLTDVHEVAHVRDVAHVADVLQVPSLLCRQTDLIEAVARSGRVVNLKRGQFASPTVMANAVNKARGAGAEHVWVCERGVMFGFEALTFDPKQLVELREACGGAPVLVDATHACQVPPHGAARASSGSRALVPVVARAAAATGAMDGLFIECHHDPASAPVDALVQIPVADLSPLLQQVHAVARASAVGQDLAEQSRG